MHNVQASDSGSQFGCLLSNACGSVTSYWATLLVAGPPAITQQPASRFVTNGNTAVFSVTASGGGPFSYQWQFNGMNLSPIITTVAGNGTPGYSGDGGPATNAGLGDLRGGITLQVKGTPSYPYVLQTTTNLTPPVSWEAVGTNLTDGDGVGRFGVAATNADSPARFFRVLGE